MATTCTRAALVSGGACFLEPTFSQHQQDALFVYLLAVLADSADSGSTGYAASPTSLWADANSLTCGMSDDQLDASLLAVFNPSITVNSYLPFQVEVVAATTAEAVEAVKCLQLYSARQLRAMKVFLFCFLFSKITI